MSLDTKDLMNLDELAMNTTDMEAEYIRNYFRYADAQLKKIFPEPNGGARPVVRVVLPGVAVVTPAAAKKRVKN